VIQFASDVSESLRVSIRPRLEDSLINSQLCHLALAGNGSEQYLFVVVVVVERATKDVPTVFAAAMNERRLA